MPSLGEHPKRLLRACGAAKARAFLLTAVLACTPKVPAPYSVPEAQRRAAVEGLAPPAVASPLRRGFALGLFASTSDPDYRRAIYQTFLKELQQAGATDVELVVRWAQSDVRATQIRPEAAVSTPDEALEEVIGLAKAQGLRVFLMPIVHVETRSLGEWRGTLEPTSWDVWWAEYQRFILHYAELAERTGVSLYSVGSELISTESQEARWRSLIAEVRTRFRGALTYSANWDHFEPVRIWDAVDYVGVTAYQPLSQGDTSEAELDRGLARFRFRLLLWLSEHPRPLLITEVGYPSSSHGARRPWDQREGPVDVALQTRCYRALYRAFAAEPQLGGIYLWNWFGVGGPEDGGYTLRGKPALEVVKRWFSGKGGSDGAKK